MLARLPRLAWTAGVLHGGGHCSGDIYMRHKPADYDGRGFAYLFGTGRRVHLDGDDHKMKDKETVTHHAVKYREGMTPDEVGEFLADLRRHDNWPAAKIYAETKGFARQRLVRLTAEIWRPGPEPAPSAADAILEKYSPPQPTERGA